MRLIRSRGRRTIAEGPTNRVSIDDDKSPVQIRVDFGNSGEQHVLALTPDEWELLKTRVDSAIKQYVRSQL